MFFTILVIIAIIGAILLGLVVLIQNPKGGGLSGSFGGAANQIFGYKRTTDDVEKITWVLVIVVFALCLGSAAMKPSAPETEENRSTQANKSAAQTGTQDQGPAGQTTEPIQGDQGSQENPDK